jgi:hypothetical protein
MGAGAWTPAAFPAHPPHMGWLSPRGRRGGRWRLRIPTSSLAGLCARPRGSVRPLRRTTSMPPPSCSRCLRAATVPTGCWRRRRVTGGWGPQPRMPAEVFDTALVTLALEAAREYGAVERGRGLLVRMQNADGGWPETTRPSGNFSYAEHISTTAWTLYALVTTGLR